MLIDTLAEGRRLVFQLAVEFPGKHVLPEGKKKNLIGGLRNVFPGLIQRAEDKAADNAPQKEVYIVPEYYRFTPKIRIEIHPMGMSFQLIQTKLNEWREKQREIFALLEGECDARFPDLNHIEAIVRVVRKLEANHFDILAATLLSEELQRVFFPPEATKLDFDFSTVASLPISILKRPAESFRSRVGKIIVATRQFSTQSEKEITFRDFDDRSEIQIGMSGLLRNSDVKGELGLVDAGLGLFESLIEYWDEYFLPKVVTPALRSAEEEEKRISS